MNRSAKGTIITLAGASCWGLCAVSGKFLVSERGVDPAWTICLRLIIAGLIFLAMDKITGRRDHSLLEIWKDRNSVIRLIMIAVFAFAVCQTTYFIAIRYSDGGIASAIQQTAPVFVMLYTVIFLRQRPKTVELVSLVIVMAGVWLLATHGERSGLIIPWQALFWGLVSAVTCAGYTIMPQPLVRKYGTYQTAGWGMLTGGILMIPVSRLWEVSGTWDIRTVLAFAYIVLIGTVLAFGMYFYGVSLVGSVRGSIYGLIEPVMAFLMSVLVLGQRYVLFDYLGCAAIIGGVILLILAAGRDDSASDGRDDAKS